jgi:hypothetical protein
MVNIDPQLENMANCTRHIDTVVLQACSSMLCPKKPGQHQIIN